MVIPVQLQFHWHSGMLKAQLKKGDKVIFTAFGAGFVHGASYYKWAYDGSAYGKIIK